ncbi:hypothetical protein DICPUDRAFT_90552 [Dictyostelium purpureum]|uniref:t-SNARE coiled-coil homology domain-containing protein n=1 Tax=Dictyostelium purpureum TaxID=5786 RepID=F1A3C4_DICPU|nr:uncharacterized protein DICPUDRAFT_90552 [Dictyostelium purpureum]EGC29304.1 hypothetical protein DICPUDRAFT_90552 [Dictyostelium purpureum]|eukprot:XP_003294172.1 hypothetical protein DICPUDRAFT_90552 [Dictyostelium purpureum]
MNGLIKRVEKINKECVDSADKSKQLNADGTTDAFTLLRRKIGLDIKGVKELITERDEAEINMPGSVRTVQLSHSIRTAIQDLKGECGKLQKMHDKAEQRYLKKNKEDPEKLKKLELTKESCEIAWGHVKELELQNKKRGSDTNQFIPRDSSSPRNGGQIKQLPDLDHEDFIELIKTDKQIDGVLTSISEQLKVTENIANEMGKAAQRQGVLLDDLDKKAEELDEKLENLNVRLGKMLKDIRKADRFMIDVILVLILLGVGAAIYGVVKRK